MTVEEGSSKQQAASRGSNDVYKPEYDARGGADLQIFGWLSMSCFFSRREVLPPIRFGDFPVVDSFDSASRPRRLLKQLGIKLALPLTNYLPSRFMRGIS